MAVAHAEPGGRATIDPTAVEILTKPAGNEPVENLPEPSTRVITRTYVDGTVVRTTVVTGENGKQSVANVMIIRPNGAVESYTKRSYLSGDSNDKGFVVARHPFRPVGQTVGSPPRGTLVPDTGEFRLTEVAVADPQYVRDTHSMANTTSDDALPTSVVPIETPVPEESATHEAFEVTIGGETMVVTVDKSDVPPGKTAQEVAEDYGVQVGRLPPVVRTKTMAMAHRIEEVEQFAGVSADGSTMFYDTGLIYEHTPSEFLDLTLHEIGHVVDISDGSSLTSSSPEWSAAMAADNADPSVYGGSRVAEDFAETFVLWYGVRSGQITGPEAAAIEERYENRFAVLDEDPEALSMLPGADPVDTAPPSVQEIATAAAGFSAEPRVKS